MKSEQREICYFCCYGWNCQIVKLIRTKIKKYPKLLQLDCKHPFPDISLIDYFDGESITDIIKTTEYATITSIYDDVDDPYNVSFRRGRGDEVVCTKHEQSVLLSGDYETTSIGDVPPNVQPKYDGEIICIDDDSFDMAIKRYDEDEVNKNECETTRRRPEDKNIHVKDMPSKKLRNHLYNFDIGDCHNVLSDCSPDTSPSRDNNNISNIDVDSFNVPSFNFDIGRSFEGMF